MYTMCVIYTQRDTHMYIYRIQIYIYILDTKSEHKAVVSIAIDRKTTCHSL